ncbi:MAG: hypothetical protein F6K58_20615 [Symploca sp. SIO2E9]|nr:hypothetical protein [Symploca sp. SIO2E9]
MSVAILDQFFYGSCAFNLDQFAHFDHLVGGWGDGSGRWLGDREFLVRE